MSVSRRHRWGLMIALVLLVALVIAPGASASGPIVHIVQRGETLYSIALRYGVSMYRIAEANHLTNLNTIYAGQRLVIPTGGTLPPQCPVYHRVQRGENLFRIGLRYGVSVWQLQRWNAIPDPDRIQAGRVLVIYPAGCTSPIPGPGPKPPPGPGPWPTPVPSPWPTPVPSPQPSPGPEASWLARYYTNRDLAGAPVVDRSEAAIDYNWGYSSPAPAVPQDNFSVRWTRAFDMTGGTYRLTVRADDGVRVYVDGIQVLDAWKVQSVTQYTVDIIVLAGRRVVTVEYFEAGGLAEIGFSLVKL